MPPASTTRLWLGLLHRGHAAAAADRPLAGGRARGHRRRASGPSPAASLRAALAARLRAPCPGRLAAGPAYARLAMRPPATAASPRWPLPPGNAPWRAAAERRQGTLAAGALGADLRRASATFTVDDGRRVDLFLAYYAIERQGAEVVHQGHRMADGERGCAPQAAACRSARAWACRTRPRSSA